MGLCYYSLGQLATGKTFFAKALGLNDQYEKARSWLEKVDNELASPAEKIVEEEPAKAGGAASEGEGGAPAVEAGAAPTPADGAAGGEVAIEPADE